MNMIDEYGVLYSFDKKRLIKGNPDLTEYKIIKGCEIIGHEAFGECRKLINIIIPNTVISIEIQTFINCHDLTGIVIPNSVTSIGWSAFKSCSSLTSIIIPDSVTSIDTYSLFKGCRNLRNVTIPKSVNKIDWSCFLECTILTEIHCKSQIPPDIEEYSFYYVDKTMCKLYVPKGSKEAYQEVWKWGFENIIEE